jgi:glycosyltransferase involved in cell wall biosynthesis
MTESLRILHVTPYYNPATAFGGVVSAVTGMAEAQAALGHHVTVLTTDALTFTTRNPTRHETVNGVDVIRCRNVSHTVRAKYNLSQPPAFGATFRQLVRDADIVHTHELRTVENLLIGRQKPVVLSPHGTLPYGTGRGGFKRGWDRLFGRSLLRKITAVAALTANEADEVRTVWGELHMTPPLIDLIPNGVTANFAESVQASHDQGGPDRLRERYTLGLGPIVLYLGRLHERKGLQFLIPAFAQASSVHRDARLLVVGPDEGMLATAMALTEQHGVTGKVRFTGLLQGEDQRAVLAAATLFVLPAVGEGLSMATLEAMAAGIPVIVTPGCNLPDVEDRGAGLLVARQTEAISAALNVLLESPERCREMGAAGQAWVRETFTWPAIAAKTVLLYRQVLDRKANRS